MRTILLANPLSAVAYLEGHESQILPPARKPITLNTSMS